MITLVTGSTNYLRVLLKYENGVYVTGATVTATISVTHGDALPGLSNVPLAEVVGNVTYNYQATIQPAQLDVTEGVLYSVEIVALFGAGNALEIRNRATVEITEE